MKPSKMKPRWTFPWITLNALTLLTLLCLISTVPASALNIFTNSISDIQNPSDSDTNPYELGIKFRSGAPGYITGIRFYKGTNNTGTHVGSLWTSGGSKLATVTFTNETATGWQEQSFTNAVAITADTTYVASYTCPNGGYAVTIGPFPGATNYPLRALADNEEGRNGVFNTTQGLFPNSGVGNNYWVDVAYATTLGPDTNAPVIVSVTPTNGTTNVNVSTTVSVTFNEAMLPTSINSGTITLSNAVSGLVASTVSFSGVTATLTPNSPLSLSNTYVLRVRGGVGGVADFATNYLATTFVSSFTTQPPDTTPPTVVSVTPTNGALGVALNTAVKVVFSESMTTSTINTNTFTLKNASNNVVPATVSYNPGTFTATLQPSSPLVLTQTYTATVLGGSSGVKDASSNALATDFVWSFTTTASPTYSLWNDGVAPQNPQDTDTSSVEVGLKFQSDVAGYITGVRFYKGTNNTGSHVGNMWTLGGSNLATQTFTNETTAGWQQQLFAAPVPVASNTTYVVSYFAPNGRFAYDNNYFSGQGYTNAPLRALANGVAGGNCVFVLNATSTFPTNGGGNNYWVDVVFATTVPPDTNAPLVLSVNPPNGATNVSTSPTVSVTFNEPMNPATITNGTITLSNAAGGLVASTVNYSGVTATLTPNSALAFSNTYVLRVRGDVDGVADVATNYLASTFASSFTTFSPDVTPPTVVSVTPTNGAVNLNLNSILTVQFNEAMETNSINTNSITLRNALSNLIPASVTYDPGTFTATLLPLSPLSLGQLHTATVLGGGSGVKDASSNALATNFVWSFTASTQPTATIWSPTNTPPISSDNAALTLGVKFRSTTNGYIRAIRFYKGAANTGTHIGNLWAGDGSKLAEATFVNETASGWQQQDFVAPILITSNTTYIASYFAPNGNYAFSSSYFTSQGITNPPLIALQSGVDGGNGVFTPGATNLFPTSSANAANYWVDVVYASGIDPDTNAPVVISTTPTSNATNVSLTTTVRAVFDEPMLASSITTNTFELRDAGNALVPATLTYNSNTLTAVLQPLSALNLGGIYTARVIGGPSGVKDTSTNALATNYVWSFTTTASVAANIWGNITPTGMLSGTDTNATELGVKFKSAMAGFIQGIRFYKGTNNSGVHTGTLWTTNGTLLASITFTNETATGWQQQLFSTPVPISSNVTYVASYFAPNGRYSIESGYFNNKGATNYPLRALSTQEAAAETGSGNGVYNDSGVSAFPISSFNAANYSVDVVFTDQNAPPVAGNMNVTLLEDTSTNIVLNGSDPEGAVTYSLVSNPAHGNLSNFNTNTGAITYMPVTNYFGADSFTYRVYDGNLFATGTVNLTIIGVNDPAVAEDQSVSIPKDSATNLVLRITDPDGFETVSEVLPATAVTTPDNWTVADAANKVAAVAANEGGNNPPRIISGTSVNTMQQFIIADPIYIQPGNPISSVILRSTCERGGNGNSEFRSVAVLGGSITLGPVNSVGTSYSDYNDFYNSPPGGGSWTLEKVKDLQIRIENLTRSIACNKFDASVNFVGTINTTYAILSGPSHGGITGLSTNNGTLTYTPTAGYIGPDSFTFRVNSGGVLSTGLVSITITGTNSGPTVANPIATQNATYGTAFNYTFPTNTFFDPDSPVLTYSATGMPPGINFTNSTRTFAGTPTTSGNYPVALVATDDSLPPLSATNIFNINVAKAALSVTASNQTKAYGVPFSFTGNEFFTTGLKLSDTAASATLSSSGSPASAVAGPYPITVTNVIGSGLSNYTLSYFTGTLTVNPPDPFSITSISVSNEIATITWQSISGRVYRLEYKDLLTTPAWTEVPVDVISTGLSTSTTNNTGGTTNRFYRVK